MFDGIDQSPVLHLVGASSWPALADRVRPHLERMADGSGGRFLVEDIIAEIFAGRMFLWVVLDGSDVGCAALTEIVAYPRFRAMRIVGLVGHRPFRWMRLLRDAESAAAKHFGCVRMEALTQRRHASLLRTGGWSEYHVLSEKVL